MAGPGILERIQRHRAKPLPARPKTALQIKQWEEDATGTADIHEFGRVYNHVEEC